MFKAFCYYGWSTLTLKWFCRKGKQSPYHALWPADVRERSDAWGTDEEAPFCPVGGRTGQLVSISVSLSQTPSNLSKTALFAFADGQRWLHLYLQSVTNTTEYFLTVRGQWVVSPHACVLLLIDSPGSHFSPTLPGDEQLSDILSIQTLATVN